MPSLSESIKSSHFLPQIRLITFQPAAENSLASSVIILEFPLTGPSRRCRLQLITNIKLLSFSRPARLIAPFDSGSSISPSPQNTQTFLLEVGRSPLFSRYLMIWAWYMPNIGPKPIETVGNCQ